MTSPSPPREEGIAPPIGTQPPEEFARQVRDALRHLHDWAHLQTHPLARFAGPPSDLKATGRGKRLQEELFRAIQALEPDRAARPGNPGGRTHRLLSLRYGEGLDTAEVQRQLALGKTEYHADHRRALDAVASLLWERWQPETAAGPALPGAHPLPGPEALPIDATRASPAGAGARRHRLPFPLTSFVGRERELAEVARLLAASRLVTLVGPPGAGKTRLALEAAAGLTDDFPDGVFFVPLAPLREPDHVGPAIAQTLGLRQIGSRHLLASLAERLRDRRALLVLDNFEQVVEAAPLVGELLTATPGPRALATSRVALRLRGEQLFPVPPLSLPSLHPAPPDAARVRRGDAVNEAVPLSASPRRRVPASGEAGEDVGRSEAVRLFVERARAVRPDFAPADDDLAVVAEICRRLDGLPLAIELAAARIGLLPPPALLARLGSRLELLRGGARDLPARQQTLERTIAWSYDLLAAPERALFRRLGEFAGGFTIEAAEAVNRAMGDPGIDVLAGLDSLVGQHLVQQEAVDGEPRFALLETLREYARRELAAHGETDAVRRAHADYYLMLIGEEATPQVGILRPVLTGALLEREQENARAALWWLLERGEVERGLGLMALFWNFWHGQGLEGEARGWSARFLARPEAAEPAVRKAVCWVSGMVAWTRGDPEAAQVCFAEGLALARAEGDEGGTERLLDHLAAVTRERGEDEVAEALFRASLTMARERGDAYAVHALLVSLGDSARLRGDAAAARSLYEESMRTHPADRSWALRNLAYLGLHAGDLLGAETSIRESLDWCREERNPLGRTQCLVALAGISAARGHAGWAARLLGAFAAGLDRIDAVLLRPERFERDRCLEEVRSLLSEPAFAAAWDEGQAMTLEQAISYALAEEDWGQPAGDSGAMAPVLNSDS